MTQSMHDIQTIQSKTSDTNGEIVQKEGNREVARLVEFYNIEYKKWFAFTLMRDLSPAILIEHLREEAKIPPPNYREI